MVAVWRGISCWLFTSTWKTTISHVHSSVRLSVYVISFHVLRQLIKWSVEKGPEEHRLKLDWATRRKICMGIARGLAHLHDESRLKIVHRDIKATNVLLDKDLNAKISDFGLAKLNEDENTHISTRIAGTM